jgi:hypothetical protein
LRGFSKIKISQIKGQKAEEGDTGALAVWVFKKVKKHFGVN